MSETEITIAPTKLLLDILERFAERVESVEIEIRNGALLSRRIVRLRRVDAAPAPQTADE